MLKTLTIKPVSNQLVITVQAEYAGSLIEESLILPTMKALTPDALSALLQDGDLRALERAAMRAERLTVVSPASQVNATLND